MAIGEQAKAFLNELASGLSGDPAKLREIYQNRLDVDEWPKVEDVIDCMPDQSRFFYILYQDIRIRTICGSAWGESTWGEKVSVYHNYRLLLESFSHPERGEDVLPCLPIDWLWDSFGFLLDSFVQCTKEKWLLLRTDRSVFDCLDESERNVFNTLWDPSAIEELLSGLLLNGSSMKCMAKAVLGMYYFTVCDFYSGYEMICGFERDMQPSSATSASDHHPQYRFERQRLSRLMGPSIVYYKSLYKMMIGQFGEASKILGRRNSSANNYGTSIDNVGLRFVQGDRRILALINICDTLSRDAAAVSSTDKTATASIEDLFRSALIPLCSPANCGTNWVFVESQLEERVVPTFMRAYKIAKEKQELVSLANLYHNVTLDKIAKVADKSYNGLENIRADLLEDTNLYLTGNSVNIQTVVKQEKYTDTFTKQVMKAKELLQLVKKINA